MASLATLDDLESYQSGDPTQALEAAEAIVRSYCGWHIAGPQTDTVTVAGWTSNGVLLLPTLMLTSVTSITVGVTAVDLTYVAVEPAGYVSLLTRSDVWWNPLYVGDATVVMTHGYDETPADVLQVVVAVAARGINAAGDGGLVATSRQVGQVSVSYSNTGSVYGAFLSAERAVLQKYRIPALP